MNHPNGHQSLLAALLFWTIPFMLTGCTWDQSGSDFNEGVDTEMRRDWEVFCQEAEQNLKIKAILYPLDMAESTKQGMLYLLYSPGMDRNTNAFIRMLGYVPSERFDFNFMHQFAKTAGGFDWDCPAMRELLSKTVEIDSSSSRNNDSLK